MATVVGKGNMVFDTITETIPGAKQSTLVHEDTGWGAIPFGMNEYQGLGQRTPKDRIRRIMTEELPKAEGTDDHTPVVSPTPDVPAVIETPISDIPKLVDIPPTIDLD